MSERTSLTARELFQGGPAPTNTREKLIDTAMNLFYANGYHAVGLDQIITAVGVTKTTFYNHFESKDALIIAVIEQRDAFEMSTWSRMVNELAGEDPRAQLLAMFDVLDVWFTDPRFLGCRFINAAVEFPSPHDPIHQAAASHIRKSFEGVVELARQAGASDPYAFAEQYCTLFQGAILMRHAGGNNEAAAVARGTAELLLEKYMPPMPATA